MHDSFRKHLRFPRVVLKGVLSTFAERGLLLGQQDGAWWHSDAAPKQV